MTYPIQEKIFGLDVVKLNPAHWQITIYKPVWGTTVTLNERVLSKAIREKVTLIVRVRVDDGLYVQEIIKPSKWKKEAKKFDKIFLYQNNPMTMYQREVIGEPKEYDDL
jgi:hypothetical protein